MAKVCPGHRVALIGYLGTEIDIYQYQLLTGVGFRWVPKRGNTLPPNAVFCGKTAAGRPLYVGRGKIQDSLTPGKIDEDSGCLFMPFGYKETHISGDFEVLTYVGTRSPIVRDTPEEPSVAVAVDVALAAEPSGTSAGALEIATTSQVNGVVVNVDGRELVAVNSLAEYQDEGEMGAVNPLAGFQDFNIEDPEKEPDEVTLSKEDKKLKERDINLPKAKVLYNSVNLGSYKSSDGNLLVATQTTVISTQEKSLAVEATEHKTRAGVLPTATLAFNTLDCGGYESHDGKTKIAKKSIDPEKASQEEGEINLKKRSVDLPKLNMAEINKVDLGSYNAKNENSSTFKKTIKYKK